MHNGTNNSLLGNVEFSGGVANVASLSNTVDLVVDGGTMMVTVLAGASNSLLGLLAVRPNIGRADIPIERAQDARHRYKQPSSDPCVSSSAAS